MENNTKEVTAYTLRNDKDAQYSHFIKNLLKNDKDY